MNLGISSCLMGSNCRYDGGHSRNEYVVDQLSSHFNLVPFCPEAIIFGTPRDAMRLVEYKDGSVHVEFTNNHQDITKELSDISKKEAARMEREQLCGFVFKSKSPTCGVERVKVYQKDNPYSEKKGEGLFAKAVRERYPYLPIEEEGRLHDPWLRENFLMQVFAYQDWFDFIAKKPKMSDLVEYHTQYKYLIYAKSHHQYKELGSIVANHEKRSFEAIVALYEKDFLEAIAMKGNKGKTYNILQHIFGYFSKEISSDEKEELLISMNEYKEGIVPLITIIKMFNLYIKRFNISYLAKQKFLHPYPNALALRSDIKAYK
jgi:uncharacterized protein YbgA (DUF1722 family)/uncharacterized protein YbbK (DUF523 family)